jgi:hypothetical protein
MVCGNGSLKKPRRLHTHGREGIGRRPFSSVSGEEHGFNNLEYGTMRGHKTFEKVELYIYRIFGLIVLIFHLVKYLKFEFSHW